jgi:type I restriction enzyme, S subunit
MTIVRNEHALKWDLVPLKSVTVDVRSWNPSLRPDDEFTYVDISSIDNESCEIVEPKRLRGREAPSRARRPIIDGDVLFSNVRTYLRNVAQVGGLPQPAVASTGFTLLRPTEVISSRYLFHLARSDFFISQVTPAQTGTHYPATSDRVVRDQLVPLPPRSTQDELAHLIDAIESKRASSSGHLATAGQVIGRFRQAVLAAACSGRITAEWRGSKDLLDWKQTRLDEVCVSIADGDHQAPPQVATGVPFITISAINDGHLRLARATRFVAPSYYEGLKESRRPQRGDVLFSVTGSIGIPALVDVGDRFTFQRHIAILRPDTSRILSEYLFYALDTSGIRNQGLAVATGTAQLTIPLRGLRAFVVSLPPIAEQQEIVRRIGQLFVTADRIEAQLRASQRRVKRSSQAVLAKAFRGDLVLAGGDRGFIGLTPRGIRQR